MTKIAGSSNKSSERRVSDVGGLGCLLHKSKDTESEAVNRELTLGRR